MNKYVKFIKYCREGNLKAAKEYYRLNPDLEISKLEEYAFCLACESDNFEFVKWLLEIKPDINIGINLNKPFGIACSNGNREIAKLIYDLLPIKPSIDNGLFRSAYLRGRKSLAEWFLEVNNTINISEMFKREFEFARLGGSLSNATWLNKISFYEYKIIFSGTYIATYCKNKEYSYNALMYCLNNANILNSLDVSTILDLRNALC